MKIVGKLLYWFAYIIIRIYFRIFHQWRIKGKKNRPKNGPLIIMANHISGFDPPIIGCVMNRQVHFMAKKELFNNPVIGKIFKIIGTFPVDRGKPDITALKTAFKFLNNGKVICIFPEGTRHKEGNLGEAKAGAVMIALRSKSPILPIGIKDATNNKNLKISIGKPFTLDKYYNKKLSKSQKEEVGKIIMKKIQNEIDNCKEIVN